MELPGKSSSEDEPQGAAFPGGETLMGICASSPLYSFTCANVPPSCLTSFFVSPSSDLGENSQLDLDSMVGPGLSSLSNDEAAMAVIMSLLETDTNLDEAVDLEQMHWSL